MLNTFLHEGSTVLDFVMIGRGSSVTTVLGRHATKLKREGRCGTECNVASAIRDMDRATDAKMVREAKVYRPILVDCE